MKNSIGLIFDVATVGHRKRGVEVLSAALACKGVCSQSLPIKLLIGLSSAIIMQTSDHYPLRFIVIAFVRGLLRRRTLGLLFRNYETSGSRLSNARRRLFRSICQALPYVRVLRITPPRGPFDGEDWIFDIEWWDLNILPPKPGNFDLSPLASDKKTLLFIGSISERKGLSYFIEAAISNSKRSSDWTFIVIGPRTRSERDIIDRFIEADGVWLDAELSDSDFIKALQLATALWCCYSPIYDQSSGIFGRALQLGKPTVVRSDSLLSVYQARYGTGIDVEFGNIEALTNNLDRLIPHAPNVQQIAFFKELSLTRIRER